MICPNAINYHSSFSSTLREGKIKADTFFFLLAKGAKRKKEGGKKTNQNNWTRFFLKQLADSLRQKKYLSE